MLLVVCVTCISADGLMIKLRVRVFCVPVLFWSQLTNVDTQLKSAPPLPVLSDSSSTENDAYEPAYKLFPPARLLIINVNVFVVLSKVSVPGCSKL